MIYLYPKIKYFETVPVGYPDIYLDMYFWSFFLSQHDLLMFFPLKTRHACIKIITLGWSKGFFFWLHKFICVAVMFCKLIKDKRFHVDWLCTCTNVHWNGVFVLLSFIDTLTYPSFSHTMAHAKMGQNMSKHYCKSRSLSFVIGSLFFFHGIFFQCRLSFSETRFPSFSLFLSALGVLKAVH